PDLPRARVRLEHVERDTLRAALLDLAHAREDECLAHARSAGARTHVHDREMRAPAIRWRRVGHPRDAPVVLGQVDSAAGEAARDLRPLLLPALRTDVVGLGALGVELLDQLPEDGL